MAKKTNTNKTTSPEVAKKASDVLQDEQTGKKILKLQQEVHYRKLKPQKNLLRRKQLLHHLKY